MTNHLDGFFALQDPEASQRFGIWYRKVPTFTAPDGPVFLQDYAHLGEIRADSLEDAFSLMQAEVWSPGGQASLIIRGLGLSHTSMSVGDLIRDWATNTWHSIANVGFIPVSQINIGAPQETSRDNILTDRTKADLITRANSAFASVQELLDAEGGYRPSLDANNPDLVFLADFYDAAQEARGDDRRAYRYGTQALREAKRLAKADRP